MRYYVISDVHGYYTQMKSALEKAGFFSDTTPHKLIMLGDLFDRGHEAKQLQQFILEQMEQDKIILIRGNHEDLFVELVTTDAGMPYSYHKSNGTYDTALQLTGFDPVMASIRHYDFADAAKTSVYKGYKQDKIEMRGDRAEMSDFPLYLNTVAGGLDRRDQTIGGFSFVVKIYAVPVVEIIG